MHQKLEFVLSLTLSLGSLCLASCNETTGKDGTTTPKMDPYAIEVPLEFPFEQLPVFPNILDDKYRIGQGMKSGTYEMVGTAIDTRNIKMASSIDSSKGGKTDVTYQVASDFTSLKQSMGLNISMNAKMGWFSASATMNQLQSTVQNSLSTFLVAKISVTNLTKRIINPQLTDVARKLLLKAPETFYNNYGDRFISGIVSGGEINIIYEFLANSIAEKNDLAISVKMQAGGLTNSVSAVVNYTKSLEEEHKSTKVKVHIIRFGDKSDLPKDDMESMLEFIKTFPEKVNPITGNPTFLYYVTDRYITASSQDPLADKQNQLEQLADKQRKIFQLLSWKQEQTTEALKTTDFALDSTLFAVTEDQRNKLLEGKKELRHLFLNLDDCFTVCRNVDACEDCKKLIGATIFNPDLTALKMLRKPYEKVDEVPITNLDNLLYVLKPHSNYRLTFRGMLLAGTLFFEPFVSSDNDRRAQETPYPQYPVIRITLSSNATTRDMLLSAKDREMTITTDENEVSIYGRYGIYDIKSQALTGYNGVLRPKTEKDTPSLKIEQSR